MAGEKKPIEGKKKGRNLTKAALIIGTASIIGYSVIKSKLLGNPPSKIRKGLLYASIAGFLLYKCQGDKISEAYSSVSENVKEIYGDVHQKNEYEKKIKQITFRNDSLEREAYVLDSVNRALKNEKEIIAEEKSELEKIVSSNKAEQKNEEELQREEIRYVPEQKIEFSRYNAGINNDAVRKIKSFISRLVIGRDLSSYNMNFPPEENIFEINNVNEKNFDEESKNTAAEMNNTNYSSEENSESKEYSTINFRRGIELIKSTGYGGENIFIKSYENIPHKDIIWIIADGNSSLNSISKKYYGDESFSERICDYNRMHFSINQKIPEGMPVALIEKGIIRGENIFKGGFPRAVDVSNSSSLEELIKDNYLEEEKGLFYSDVFNAIDMYNSYYGKDLDLIDSFAKNTNESYYVLIPRILKNCTLDIYSELWVGINAESGKY